MCEYTDLADLSSIVYPLVSFFLSRFSVFCCCCLKLIFAQLMFKIERTLRSYISKCVRHHINISCCRQDTALSLAISTRTNEWTPLTTCGS